MKAKRLTLERSTNFDTPGTAGHQKKRLGVKPSPSIWSDFHDAKMIDRQSISESHPIFNNEYDFADRNITSPSLAKEDRETKKEHFLPSFKFP